ncbi:cache domain-containing protein [Candidatus Gottesmanbacteria bacterium]|nr:cache domain-containing protein [Candidatus Gottesmanbacteria bacterium]
MFWRTLPTRMWLMWLCLMIGLGATFYGVLSLGAKATIAQQLLHRQQILARAEGSNITSYFQVFGDAIAVFAQLESTRSRNVNVVRNMDAFVEQWRDSGLVGGIVLTDKQGVVRFNSNVLGTRDIGASLADRDYFVWAKNQSGEGEYFVGQPVVSRLGASKDQAIVVVASPVFQQGAFTGVLAASVKLQPLTQRYLELLKVSDSTDVYLINKSGDLLYSRSAADVGARTFKLLNDDTVKRAVNTTGEGTLETEEHLIAYSSLSLRDQHWLIIMSTPIQTVVSLTTPIYIRQLAIFLLVSLTILLFGVVAARQHQKSL